MPQASIRFFGNDWRSDARLRLCSAAARGVWIDLMSFMMEAKPFGSLLINDARPTVEQIAALTVTPTATVRKAMNELKANGVYSTDEDGTIYSRRMRRDAQRAAEAREHGKRGGNPQLKGEDNEEGYAGGLTPPDKPQGSTPNPIPNPSPESDPLFDDFWRAYPSRGEAANPKKPALLAFAKLVKRGAAPAEIIAGARGYAAHCRHSGKAGSELVMQATRFLNQEVWDQYANVLPMKAKAARPNSMTPEGQEAIRRSYEVD